MYPKNETEFIELLKMHPIVVLDIYSADCPPCSKLAPIYERTAQEYASVAFVKIQRQEHRTLAESFNIFSSPTILFFLRGTLQEKRLAGDIEEKDIRSEVERLLQQENALLQT